MLKSRFYNQFAVHPPSIGIAAPLISCAASEHRNKVNSPICLGWIKFNDGYFSFNS